MNNPLVLLTGCQGQLGSAIQHHWDASLMSASFDLMPVDIDQLDLTDSEDLIAYLNQLQPSIIINTAAFTHVDDAEANRAAAYAVNADAVRSLARWCQGTKCKLIQISTDFVFDGSAKTPYATTAETNPLSMYGESKLVGENYVLDLLPHKGCVVRTSWLYSEYGNNFVKNMLRFMNEGRALEVVNDQIGSPTSAHTLTFYLFELIRSGATPGLYHWCDGGEISWFNFAEEIYTQGKNIGLIDFEVQVEPISSIDYVTPAIRPAYSVLDRSASLALMKGASESWESALRYVLRNLERGHAFNYQGDAHA